MRYFFTTQRVVIFSLIVSLLIAIFAPTAGPNGQLNVLFGAASFVFWIVIAFYISMSTTRLNDLGQALNQEDANYVSIYKVAAVFGEEIQDKLRKRIDLYLQDQIDHYLSDFEQTHATFDNLVNFIVSINPNNEKERLVYGKLLDYVDRLQHNRIRIIALAKSKLLFYEWATILTLAAIILFCIFALNDGSLVSIIVSVLLSTSTIMLILILRDLVFLRWKEQMWIWSCLTETFQGLGLSPYYPQSSVDEGRVTLKKGVTVRLVSYPNRYPDFSNKRIIEKKA